MPHYQIKPINVGTITGDKSQFTYMRNFGQKVESPSIVWAIEGAGETIMVDTGPPDPEWSTRYHWPLVQTEQQRPEIALKAAGVDPERVRLVILSHLHWDHAFNNRLFPNAEFVVQREEIRYAIAPLPVHYKAYEHMSAGMKPDYITSTRYTFLDGDTQLRPGISVILTPGHSPGSMCTLVETAEGLMALATDTVPLFENWHNNDPTMPHLPSTILVNLFDYFASLDRIEKTGAKVVLPGHDPKVFDREVWG
jgi:glyoxylase-like metal-dependent hydrolase (beta-lactamase superfamily II)